MVSKSAKTAVPERSDDATVDGERRRGRGARSNRTGRFESELREEVDDGWEGLGDLEAFKTEVYEEPARTIITRNDSPDISLRPLDQPLPRLRARLHLLLRAADPLLPRPSPGLDFETKLFAKPDAAELLERELAKPRYMPEVDRARHQHRSLPADRARAQDHALDPRGARAHFSIPSASSPSRRWSCATSTSWRDMAERGPGARSRSR